ncbi:MAG: hypothetical protein ABIF10_07415 [Candidatus Woesearchaeota archaeon]
MWGKRFVAIIIIAFFYFLALIPVVFDLKGIFVPGLFVLLALLFFAFMASIGVYLEKRWSWGLYTLVFALGLANVMWIYYSTTRLFLFAIAIVTAVIGFLMSVLNIKAFEDYEYKKYKEKVDKGNISDDEVIVEEIKPIAPPEPPVEPRRYVGSMKSTEYHKPQCLAAKRINKKNQVWFTGKSDAEKQGYSGHSCVD